MIQQETAHNVMKCCIKAHSFLKSGFQKVIYQRALAIGLLINFEAESLAFKPVYDAKHPDHEIFLKSNKS